MQLQGTTMVRLDAYERQRPLVDVIFGELQGNWFKLVPPLEVLNRELASGVAVVLGPTPKEKQLFYNWIPFEIEWEEYQELVTAAERMPGRPFGNVQPPKEVLLPDEWAAWAMGRAGGKS